MKSILAVSTLIFAAPYGAYICGIQSPTGVDTPAYAVSPLTGLIISLLEIALERVELMSKNDSIRDPATL